jgi:ABC-type polysaccharide/polyol phosphate export permease
MSPPVAAPGALGVVEPAPTHARQGSWRTHARLVSAFTRRNLHARFTATTLGLVWTLIAPLATVAIYSTVFAVIFRAAAPAMGTGHPGVFAIFFFVGLVTWNLFAQGSNQAMMSIVQMGAMLQKVAIPAYVPVFASVLTTVVEKCLEATVMLLVLAAFGNIGWTWLLYPLAFAATALFACALGYILAVANAHLRDTAHLFAISLQLWFFLTPIMYSIVMIPEQWHGLPLRTLLNLNPVTQFVVIARDLLYLLQLPSLGSVLYALGCLAVTCGAAVLVHRRWGLDISEAL